MRRTTSMIGEPLPQQQEANVFAEDLRGISQGLRRLRDSLPEPSTAMLEGEEPKGVAAELAGVVECVLHDDIEPAISKLKKAAHGDREGAREGVAGTAAPGGLILHKKENLQTWRRVYFSAQMIIPDVR